MQKIPFILKKLSIKKMPGLPEGLKDYKDFSSHINLIAGPNASGKSSTARMIQKIISRNNTERMQAQSIVELDRENWQINIDSNHIQVQREGMDDQITGIPSLETQQRYMLAFHELINHNEQDLARQIIREANGGYDLDQAIKDLKYDDAPSKRNVSEFKNYKKALEEYNKISKEQQNLKKEEESLQELYRKKEKAKEADKKKELF
jgi:energy-coupling factor transporter ATP-binding protein EcfA2